MEGYLNYNLGGVERRFFYGTYALGKTLRHFGFSISDLSDPVKMETIDNFEYFIVFTFHAAAFVKLEKEETIDFNLMNVYKWIDQDGGITGGFMLVGIKAMNEAMGLKEGSDVSVEKKNRSKKKG